MNAVRPAAGRVLFIAGQSPSQLGGDPEVGLGDGYLDHMKKRPAGFSLYCSFAPGMYDPSDPGAFDRICSLPALSNSLLYLSVNWVADFDESTAVNNRAITEGLFDDIIDSWAAWCAAQPRPVLLRLGAEFDRQLPVENFHYDPEFFADAYRRVVGRFRSVGAENVAFALASTNAPSIASPLTDATFESFYPGDDYVDWFGFSMWSPSQIDTYLMEGARKRGKPVLLAETTPMKYNIGQGAYYPEYFGRSEPMEGSDIWDSWHRPMVDFIINNADVIGAWQYIGADWSSDPAWKDVPQFAFCDARPWADDRFLELWERNVEVEPFVHAHEGLLATLSGER